MARKGATRTTSDTYKNNKLKSNKKHKNKNKIKNNIFETKKRILKIIFFILLIFVAIVSYYLLNNGHKLGLSLKKNITIKDSKKIALTNSDNIIRTYLDKILVYEAGTIKVFSTKGHLLFENKVENIYSPDINTENTYIQLVNKTTGDIFVFDGRYQIGTISLGKEIISSKITKNGMNIVHYKALGTSSAISIFDKKGNELYKINLDSNQLNDFVLTDNNRYLVYIEPNTQGISIISNVNLIDLKDGKGEITKIISKENEIVYNVNIDNYSITMLTDSKVINYNIITKKVKEENINEKAPINIALNNSKYIYTELKNENDKYIYCNIIKFGKTKIRTFKFEGVQKYFKVSNDLIVLGYQDELHIYNMYGQKIKHIKTDGVITEPQIFNNGKNLIMIISSNVLIFNIGGI